MSDERLIRVENLNRLIAARSLTFDDLRRDVGGRYTYWRDLTRGEKSFGEKAARKIEDKLNLPRGWLDTPGQAVPAAAPVAISAAGDGLAAAEARADAERHDRPARDLLAAVELIADRLADADEMVRDAAAPILAKLAQSPGEAVRIARMLEMLLGSRQAAGVPAQTTPAAEGPQADTTGSNVQRLKPKPSRGVTQVTKYPSGAPTRTTQRETPAPAKPHPKGRR